MGLETHIYLGPYLRARPKVKQRTCQGRRCSSGKCKINERQAGSFCPACGQPLETYQQETGYMVRDLDVDPIEEIDQALYNPFTRRTTTNAQWEIWLPNRSGPREFDIDQWGENEIRFEEIEHSRKAEEVWFATTFPKPLEFFKTRYLETELTWGLLIWAS